MIGLVGLLIEHIAALGVGKLQASSVSGKAEVREKYFGRFMSIIES